MFLFTLWGINFDFKMLISFFIGVGLGVVLAILIYLIFVLSSLKSKKFIIKTENDDLKISEVKELIEIAKNEFKNKSLRGERTKTKQLSLILKDLIYAIASRYYPNSKYPLLEISIDELIMLFGYVEKRLNDILDKKGLRYFKRFKLSTLFYTKNTTDRITDSKVYEVGMYVKKATSVGKKILNAINPIWWVRKGIIDNTLSVVLNKLYLILIEVVGEESYKIYSKKFTDDDIIFDDSSIDELIDEIASDFNDAKIKLDENITDETSEIMDSNYELKKKIFTSEDIKNNDYESIFDEYERLKEKMEIEEEQDN